MTLFTLGYQNSNLETYCYTLTKAKVSLVIDVRERAWSYNRQFIKSRMTQALENCGIGYLHISSAGNPSINRKSAVSVQECLENYRQYLDDNPEQLSEFFDVIKKHVKSNHSVCLTCYEKEHVDCHRSILAEKVKGIFPDIKLQHLQINPPTIYPQTTNLKLSWDTTAQQL